MNQTLGFAHYWAQGDAVTHAVAYLLLLMSISDGSCLAVLASPSQGLVSRWRVRRWNTVVGATAANPISP